MPIMRDSTLESKSASGHCLCGKVEFRVNFPTRWCAHCHCSMCQIAHGAAFVTWVGVPKDKFELISGEKRLSWYASSEQASRGYCNRCGTTLFFRSSRWGVPAAGRDSLRARAAAAVRSARGNCGPRNSAASSRGSGPCRRQGQAHPWAGAASPRRG